MPVAFKLPPLILVPSLWIGLVELVFRKWFPDGRFWFLGFANDICNDLNYIIVFLVGYGLAATDDHGMKKVIKKGRWWNLILGTLILTVYSAKFLLEGWFPYGEFFFYFLRGFAEWLFLIGIYGVFREAFTKSWSWIPLLSELAMPFYLTHQQILVPIAASASWVPYLSKYLTINFHVGYYLFS